MFATPCSLQDTCIEFISENLENVCKRSPVDSELVVPTGNCKIGDEDSELQSSVKVLFKDSNAKFRTKLSEQILSCLCEKNKLSDLALSLFAADMSHMRLTNAATLTANGLQSLKAHKISSLEVPALNLLINDLTDCLGEWTIENLKSLNISKCSLMCDFSNCEALSKFCNLESLNVSYTDFSSDGLYIIVENLHNLVNLDISCTLVDTLSPLLKCKDRFKSLVMYNLKLCRWDNVKLVISELHELRVLDMSDENSNLRSNIQDFLVPGDKLKQLTELDISGKSNINIKDLRIFLKQHKSLRFLGLIYSEVCSDESFIVPTHPDCDKNLLVTGTASETQILGALKRYKTRPFYVRMCLYHVCRLAANFTTARVDIIELILSCMVVNSQELGVQIAATICLYNLTKGCLVEEIHPNILKRVVEQIMTAMEIFPEHYRLQFNSLRILCSNRISQDVSFDKLRCAKLVMNALCAFEDEFMNKTGIEICLFLSDSISSSVDSLLQDQPQYMRKLLDIAKNKLKHKTLDVTFSSIISVLWNIADSSPNTCKLFLELGGILLFLDIIEIFEDEEVIEGLILGIFNKISRVIELRPKLMVQDFIDTVRRLLYSKYDNVACFAAAILSKLLKESPETWRTTNVTKEQVEQELMTMCLCKGVE